MRIYMYFQDHNPPHFHIVYNEFEAVIEIKTLALTQGKLPPKVLSLVIERAVMHQEELLENRNLASSGEIVDLKKIAPLV